MSNQSLKELKELNAKLAKLNQAKTHFISLASHQLRTPLAAIRGYAHMLLDGDYGKLSLKQDKAIAIVLQSAGRLARLVDTLLNISRIESGRLQIILRPVKLAEILQALVHEFASEAALKKQQLTFTKPAKVLPPILADGAKLQEIFGNLVDNALKYTPVGGRITVSLKTLGDKLITRVSDSGIGIDPAETTKLFKRFSRGKQGQLLHPGGSGLGLYIVQKIVAAHHGQVRLESAGQGKGSVFTVTLPIRIAGYKPNDTITLPAEDVLGA